MIQQMQRLSAMRLEADVGQEAAILPLRVWGQVEKVMEEAVDTLRRCAVCPLGVQFWP